VAIAAHAPLPAPQQQGDQQHQQSFCTLHKTTQREYRTFVSPGVVPSVDRVQQPEQLRAQTADKEHMEQQHRSHEAMV
jgi:hypothetical protein